MKKRSSLQKNKKRSEMTDAQRVRDFQRKLYRKAKQEKKFRFYVLYDKVSQMHVLRESYRRAKANKGAPGVDNVSFEDVERTGVEKLLIEIQVELREKKYKPQAVKRVMIPKANGDSRPLGIPTIKDRIVQMACKMVIEPIFEADFQEGSYGFRPKRSAHGAIKAIKGHLEEGRTTVYDADISKYFDEIPHGKLLKVVGMRVSDKNILHLVKLWLRAPIMDESGRIIGGKRNKKGTPQGGVISPLLANIYLNVLDRVIGKMKDYPDDLRIVRYADDFVLMGKEISQRTRDKVSEILSRMELRINEDKTRYINAEEEPFGFLGFTIQRRWSKYTYGKKYYHIEASKESRSRLKQNVKEYLRNTQRSQPEVIRGLNQRLIGWLNYYNIPGDTAIWNTTEQLSKYLRERICRHIRRKSQRYNAQYSQIAYYKWVEKHGLVDLYRHCRPATAKA